MNLANLDQMFHWSSCVYYHWLPIQSSLLHDQKSQLFYEDLLFIWSLLLDKVHLSQISFVFSVWQDR